jgi:hypothetical protein
LVCRSLWNQLIFLDFLPKRISAQVRAGVRTDQLKQLDAFNDGELLLPANIQLLAVFGLALNQEIVVSLLQKLVATNIGQRLKVGNPVNNPGSDIYLSKVKILHFQLG